MNTGPARIHLRLMAGHDAALYAALYGDAETMRHIAPPLDAAGCGRSFAAACRANTREPPALRFWVICDAADDRGFGLVGLRWTDGSSVELGVVLPPDRQGLGHGSAAIRALLAPGLLPPDLRRLHTRHAANHGLAAGLMAGLGFRSLPADETTHGQRWELRLDAVRPASAGRS